MHVIDYSILFVYFAVLIFLGLLFSKKQHSQNDFFLAGRSMGWFPIGISVMITAFSAINYTAFSGEVFAHGLYVTLSLPIFVLVAWPVTRIFIPFFHDMQLSSAYEYLEKRFDGQVRMLASGLFIIWRLLWGATVLYVPCKVLSGITGIPTSYLILIAGFAATLYTLLGGMQAVMWTDVLQFFVLIGGLLLSLGLAIHRLPDGWHGILLNARSAGILKPFVPFDPGIFSFDPRIRITLWSCWIGTFVTFLTRYGTDQVILQRYFTARSLRHARRGFHLNYISAIFALLLLTLLGLVIHSYSVEAGFGDAGARPVFYFSQFVKSLPPGITGLIVAGLFAASMSSLDSAINSCSAAFTIDFYERLKNTKQVRGIAELRVLALGFGFMITLMALFIGRLGSIFEIANKIVNGFGSPLLAIFLLALFSKTANSRGVLIGGLIGAIWSASISLTVTQLALHYYAVVNLLGSLFFCYLFSRILIQRDAGNSPEQLAWTYRARMHQR